MISDHRVPPKVWCSRRALSQLERDGMGRIGNAYGTLRADLMRHADTVELVKILDTLDGEEKSLREFIAEYLA